MAKVTMYTDGGASGNPGPGGYGTLLMYGEHVKEISEGFRLTTNNRMELLAVIVGLEALTRDGVEVDVYSDSKYVVDAVMKRWVFNWEKKGYKDKKPRPVAAVFAHLPQASGDLSLGEGPCRQPSQRACGRHGGGCVPNRELVDRYLV